MNIQQINQQQSPNFQRLIIKRGSFDAIKQCQSFRNSAYAGHKAAVRSFYKGLMGQKKIADKNSLFNVVFKPAKPYEESRGKVVIEDLTGNEQFGFTTTFEDLTSCKTFEEKEFLTEEEEPNMIMRFLRNQSIKSFNKRMNKQAVNFEEYLNIVLKRIQSIIRNAECLQERTLQKTTAK